MQLAEILKEGTTISRKKFWDKTREIVLSLQKKAGRNVSVDERKGLGTVINVVREIGGEAEPTGACCHETECTEGVTQSACEGSGGVWVGPGTTCDPNPCLNECQCAIPVTLTMSAHSASFDLGPCPVGYGGCTWDNDVPEHTFEIAAEDFNFGQCLAAPEFTALELCCEDQGENFCKIFGDYEPLVTIDCAERTLTVVFAFSVGAQGCNEPCGGCDDCFGNVECHDAFQLIEHTLDLDAHDTYTFDDHYDGGIFDIASGDVHGIITY